MLRSTTLILLSTLLITVLKAQPSLTFATGISINTNAGSTSETFNHIPITLQWKPSASPQSPFFIKLDYDLPISGSSTGYAYTLNPSLPQEVTLQENVRPYIFTASIGFHIHLYTAKNKNVLYLDLLPFGICNQNFKVNYKNYDKTNYNILNPDINLNKTNYVASIGATYRIPLQKLKDGNNLLVMLHLQSPLAAGTGAYPLSYKYVAPLELTVGYNFYYNKKRK
jgi:hypothetical protein